MTEDVLNLMRMKPGIYLFGDSNAPGRTFPVVVTEPLVSGPCDAPKITPGSIFALEPRYPVEATAAGFGESIYLAGGPYSIQQIEAEQERELEHTGLECEADYFKDIALRAEAQLRFARTFQDPKSEGFAQASDLIERIENYRRSQAILQHSEKMVNEAQANPKKYGEPLWEGPPPMWQAEPPKA